MKKGILQIFISNVIFLICGMINNFVLPKFLSVEAYAGIKSYMLYIGYAYFLAFGFIEGMFLKYGGKTIKDVKQICFGNNFKTFLYVEVFIAGLITVIGICFRINYMPFKFF